MFSRGKLIFAIICGALCGLVFAVEALHVFAVRNAPIVTGRILRRDPIRQYSVPRVDFTIQIQDSDVQVHARTQGHLMTKVPDTVRFHYNGDSTREVFLFEHEENPYWVVLFCWSAALVLGVCSRSARVQRALGWKE